MDLQKLRYKVVQDVVIRGWGGGIASEALDGVRWN